MPHDISDHLLERYCAGECTAAEQTVVEQWAAADSANAEMLALLVAAWRATGSALAPADRPDVAAAWGQVHTKVRGAGASMPTADSAERRPRAPRSATPPRRSVSPWAAVAAAIALTVGGALLTTRITTSGTAGLSIATAPMREVVTHRGQRATLDLPDGSRLIVAAESRVRIPRTYQRASGPRDVFLDQGQAYFEVRHDRTRPFSVHAVNGVVEDLGTEFVVTAYPETGGLEVAVASGAVALRAPDRGHARRAALLTLAPGEVGRLDTSGTAVLTRGAALEPYLAWTTGGLAFDSTSMRDVAAQLSRWYKLDIRFADRRLAERRLTAEFHGETEAQVLEQIAMLLGVRIERHDRVAVLREYTR